MKKHLYFLAILALGLSACGPTYVVQRPAPPASAPVAEPLPPPPPAPEPEASYQSFYDDLSPYGQWINDPRYGYVWLPAVGPDFKPYATNGHWVYTDEGWTWASDYTWGWAAFHYGRWFFQDGYGWMRVPGNEYAPAWVTWRNSDEYYGWAPMGPGVNFDMAYGGGYMPPAYSWCFVPHQYVGSPYVRNYYVNESRNVTIINHTTVINHVTVVNNNYTRNVNYGRGPDPVEVGRYTGTTLRPMPVRMSNRPVPGGQMNNGGLSIYRPRINDAPRNNNGNTGVPSRMAPARVSNLNDARPQNTAVYGSSRPASTGFPNRDNNPVNARPASGYDRGNGNDRGNDNNRGNGNDRGNGYDRGNGNDRGNHYGEQRQDQVQPQQQQPAGQPQGRGWGRPANSGGQPQGQSNGQPNGQPQGQPNGSRPDVQQPVNNQPATQPANNQPVTNNRPALQPTGRQPEMTPIHRRPFGQPQGQPAAQQPQGQPNNRPVTQAPANNPSAAQPHGQPARNFTPPARPVTQQQQQRTQPVQAPAVQSRPVSRPVTPPPAPQKQEDKKDTRPVRQ